MYKIFRLFIVSIKRGNALLFSYTTTKKNIKHASLQRKYLCIKNEGRSALLKRIIFCRILKTKNRYPDKRRRFFFVPDNIYIYIVRIKGEEVSTKRGCLFV